MKYGPVDEGALGTPGVDRSRVAFVIYSELVLGGGGRQTWLEYFLPALAETRAFCGIDVICLAKRPSARTVADARGVTNACGSPIRFISGAGPVPPAGSLFATMRNIIKFCASLFRYVARERPSHLVLVGTVPEGIAGTLVRLFYGRNVKLLTWIRGLIVGDLLARRRKGLSIAASVVERATLLTSDVVIANGRDTFDYYQTSLFNRRKQMITIPNAVDVKRFAKVPVPSASDSPLRVVFLGRLSVEKGFDDFLDSVQRFNDNFCKSSDRLPPVEFHCYGVEGAMNRELPGNTWIHGPVKQADIEGVLDRSHAIVFLNKSGAAGGLSHAILEALAAGRISIAWDNSIHNQILNDNFSLLVNEGDIVGLANAYAQLRHMTQDEFRAYASAARTVAGDYSVEKHVDKFLNLLHEA